MSFFTPDFIEFFKELAPNNNKDWFDENRSRYEKVVREPFKKFVDHMIAVLSAENPNLKDLQNKDCIFRINRDIRFSKDKTPYKLNVSAAVFVGGKKEYKAEGAYFELSPEHVRVYGGLYELDKDALLDVREGIAANLKEFQKIYTSKSFESTFGAIRGEQNKVLPKELKVASVNENLLFNKQFYYFAEFPPEILLEDDFDQTILKIYQAGRPMEQFFSKILKR
ncbi:MAG: DUF2461 domain-containing protein [Crocinitomicaceae bacterium]